MATVVLKVAPAANFGTVVAAILIFSPVFGFLPSRAARGEALNEPKPTNETPSPVATASTMVSITASRNFPEAVLVGAVEEDSKVQTLPLNFLFHP